MERNWITVGDEMSVPSVTGGHRGVGYGTPRKRGEKRRGNPSSPFGFIVKFLQESGTVLGPWKEGVRRRNCELSI